MVGWFGHSGFIARFTGKVLVALGFILGTYGLTEGQPDVMKAGLGLLIAGVISSAYGLYHQITHPLDPPTPVAPGRASSRDETADQRGGPKP